MPRNIEIKARIASVETLIPIAEKLADEGPIEIAQDDTFFHCEHGRLKLREFSEAMGELIHYERSDAAGPKESSYILSPTNSPATLRQALSLAYGVLGRGRKRRILFLAGRTRIHLNRVEGLGDFLELEVVMNDGESNEVGIAVAEELLNRLGVAREQLVEGAYLDLLTKRPKGGEL